MRKARALLVAFAVLLGLSGTGAIACSFPLGPDNWVDPWIEVADDGSFVEAGETYVDEIEGAPIVDLGDARVGQRLYFHGGCSIYQKLLFVDCRAPDAVMIDGIFVQSEEPRIAGFISTSISAIQAPKGALDWNKVENVDDVLAVSRANGYHVTRNVPEFVMQMKWRNRFDPFNGCKIHYPDSAGARH